MAAVPPTPVELQVREESQGAEFAVSDNGMLAYVSGNPQGYVSRLVIVDRKGTIGTAGGAAPRIQRPDDLP